MQGLLGRWEVVCGVGGKVTPCLWEELEMAVEEVCRAREGGACSQPEGRPCSPGVGGKSRPGPGLLP